MAGFNGFPMAAILYVVCGSFLLVPGLMAGLEPKKSLPPDLGAAPPAFELLGEQDWVAHQGDRQFAATGVIDLGARGRELPREPRAGYFNYLNSCGGRMSYKCGNVIYGATFKEGVMPVDYKCCRELVSMGKTCHDDMVGTLVRFPDYKDDASIPFRRSSAIWNRCVLIVGAVSPSPSP